MKRLAALPVIMLVLAGCGGGGSASSPKPAAANGQTQTGTLSLTFGTQTGTAAQRRNPKFVSPNAATALISINNGTATSSDVSATSSLCQTASNVRTCGIPLTVPVGLVSIGVTLKSAAPSSLTLGSGSNSVTVVAGTNFSLTVGVNPVATAGNTISYSPSPSFQYGMASSITATVVFDDPSGATITGSGNVPNYLVPVTITSSDSHVTITPPALTTPGQTFTAHYDGSALAGSLVTITAMTGSTVIASNPVIIPGLIANRCNLALITAPGTIGPSQIVVGPDNKMWWGELNTHMLGHLDPAGGCPSLGHIPTALGTGPVGVASGGDGNIWYGGGPTIGRVTIGGAAPGTGPASFAIGGQIQQLQADSQGNVWFVNSSTSQIGYIDAGPTFTVHLFGPAPPVSGSLTSISGLTLGADNAMYFTENGGTTRAIGRVTTPANGVAGTIAEFAVPNSSATVFPWDIAAGPDGNIWFVAFANTATNQFFAKLAPTAGPTANIAEFAGTFDSNAFANLVTIAKGPDGNMWIAEGGGAVSINPANPTIPVVQFFSDNGQTTMEKCVRGPAGDANLWCTAVGSAALSPGFIDTTDAIVSWKAR